jgi:hypothetical protein
MAISHGTRQGSNSLTVVSTGLGRANDFVYPSPAPKKLVNKNLVLNYGWFGRLYAVEYGALSWGRYRVPVKLAKSLHGASLPDLLDNSSL